MSIGPHQVLAGMIPSWDWERIFVDPWRNDGSLTNTLWVLALSALIGIACGVVGNFLILRRMALTGDAISHSVLPGLVMAYVIFDTLDSWAMILGAAAAGVVAVMLIEFLHRNSRLKADAAMGVAFATLFALGVLLIRRFAGHVHLDVECVLYGHLEMAVLGTTETPFGPVPIAVVRMLAICALVCFAAWLFYKELLFTSFDAAMAATMGVKCRWIHHGLMLATSLVVVGAMEAVGAVLVVGMMIIPPATARLLSNRLPMILLLTLGFVLLATLGGRHLGAWLNTPLAASTMVVSGVVFGFVWSLTLLRRTLVP